MRPRLIIAMGNHSNAMRMRQGVAGFPEITVVELPAEKLPTLAGLDAVFLSLPAAEKWGSRPLLHRAQILSSKLSEGTPSAHMPPYVITGVAMAPDDPQDPVFELQLIVTAVLEAVRFFNIAHPDAIRAIGFWAENLGVDRLDPERVGKIVRSIYEKILSLPMS
jgi:hypothetical protein